MSSSEPPPYPGDPQSGVPSYPTPNQPPPGGYSNQPPGGDYIPPPPPQFSGPPSNNTKALVAMILGIVGLVLCPCSYGLTSIGMGIAALILGRIGGREIAQSGGTQSGEGMAKAGFILGIVNLVAAVLFAVALIIVVALFGASVPTYP